MSQTIDALALLRAVLGDNCGSDEAADKYLVEAARLGADPLDYCAHRFGLGTAPVWQRAAHWAGFPFTAVIPAPQLHEEAQAVHLDRLGEIRSLRQTVSGHALTFGAPGFEQVLNLARSRQERPELARRLCFAPPDAIEAGLARAASNQLMDAARQRITAKWPEASAAQALPRPVRVGFVVLLVMAIGLVMAAGLVARPVLMPIVALLLMAPGLLRLLAAIPPRSVVPPPTLLDDMDLPVYTVLVPLRDEAGMVPMLQRGLSALDYPAERLDIKFVVEARSPETIAAVRDILGDPRFRLVVVPEGAPHTKPKAIDYALPLARGKYLVVYDAEDVPDPLQLREAASRFEADAGLACLQAELVPENAGETALTALFAGEYAGLFGRLLPALARWGLPMPLGGTSNHFRTDVLREIGGWDAFNVTEDADIGVRLARRGFRAEAFESRTFEEAPLTLRSWMAQRTRWMKGWMQTFVVHNRAPNLFLDEIGWRGFLAFQALVGGMILSSLLHTVLVGSLAVRVIVAGGAGLVPQDIWDWVALGILATGYGGALAVVISGLAHQRALHLLPAQLLLPAYWALHSIAAMLATVELITKPVYWAKTTHGLTQISRQQAPPAAGPTRALRPRTG
ncbi:MAG: glycosyltransferase [Devosia nanyangense]|uniref:Glycosyltransferase n=1 Tax=Devosia nanyangense TaxID=1228055 RepID=A0A933L2H4_9HYPH|nr:glycosyltransferase [Devosia nanyangense]